MAAIFKHRLVASLSESVTLNLQYHTSLYQIRLTQDSVCLVLVSAVRETKEFLLFIPHGVLFQNPVDKIQSVNVVVKWK